MDLGIPWRPLRTVEKKAKADLARLLLETFSKVATGRPANLDIVVIKLGPSDRFKLVKIADAMELETVSVDAPWKNTSNKTWLPTDGLS